MTPSTPPTSTEVSGRTDRVKALLADEKGQSVFRLTYRQETISLLDSSSLNRWASLGVVDRHNVSLSSDGVTIDGRHVLYADPRAVEMLETMLNRSSAAPHPIPHPGPGDSHSRTPSPLPEPLDSAAFHFADDIKVTRDGFEFHVRYRTRFGETKTEKLEGALETFQRLRAFKAHINIQKSGIRLVVTRWDGENFIEEPGIPNLEHASPQEVESLIRTNLQGGQEGPGPHGAGAPSLHPEQPAVVALKLARRPHESRFHLLVQRQDGSVEEGPLLIRSNMPKLLAQRLFSPDVSVSMTALNDRLVIECKAPDGTCGVTDSLPLETAQDASRVEQRLNSLLIGCSVAPSRSTSESTVRSEAGVPGVTKAPPVRAAADDRPAPLLETESPAQAAASARAGSKASEEPAQPGLIPTAQIELPTREPTVAETTKLWGAALLKSIESIGIEDVNSQIFAALRERFDRPVSSNDHGFPSFTFESPSPAGPPAKWELVLTTHCLLCSFSFGYVRFGTETRFFLERLNDYVAFPHAGLCGVAEKLPSSEIQFLINDECGRFLEAHHDRSYRAQFGTVLKTFSELLPADRLLWPLSQEDRLFQITAAAAKSYGLPVTADRIVMDPHATVFVGFIKVSPHGMEFQDGEDFVRFTPAQFELREDGQETRFVGTELLRGWALDHEGHLCAFYRAKTGFQPPVHTKLVRFIPEEQLVTERQALTVLAAL